MSPIGDESAILRERAQRWVELRRDFVPLKRGDFLRRLMGMAGSGGAGDKKSQAPSTTIQPGLRKAPCPCENTTT